MPSTTTDLIASVKRRTGMPAAQASFTASEILALANEEMGGYVVPLVLKQREDYWIAHQEEPLLDGVSTYPAPDRAIGGKLREVLLLDASRRPTNLPRLDAADVAFSGDGFMVDADGVTLVSSTPTPSWPFATLRVSYYLRPSQLVEVAAAAVISDLDVVAGTVTLESVPAAFSGNDAWDLVSSRSPFSVRGIEQPGVLAGSVITFTSLPANVRVGDYACLPDQSPVPQIPSEMHPLLAQKTACRVLESKQMTEKLGPALTELARLEQNCVALIAPRVDGEAQRVVVRRSLQRTNW